MASAEGPTPPGASDGGRRRREAAKALRRRRADHLRQAQKNEAIAQLTSGVAHDFNNLLVVVLGTLDLIRQHPAAGPGLAPLIDAGRQAAERGASLTRHLLAFSRNRPAHAESTDVNALIGGVLGMLTGAIGEPWPIRFTPGPGLWRAMVDGSLLESALLNLALNARDAQPAGGTITIAARNLGPGAADGDAPPASVDDYVVITVHDAGIGMSPDVAARALEPFFSTKPFGKGSGLGLSMVHTFMTQVGGHVRLDTAPGEGTTVSLYLPRAAGVSHPAPAPTNPVPGGGESILVVEDNELVRSMAVRLLESLGYSVLQTGTGIEAVALLEAGARVDLLFTDVVMPGEFDGIGLTGRARALRPGLRVLLTSGHPLDGLSPERRELEAVRTLPKPYALRDLAQAVRDTLDA